MTKEEYRSILGQLPIKNPTAQDMARMCPHLTQDQAVKAFTTGEGYVACPPLRVRHRFQILSYRKEWVEEIKVSRVKDGTEDASVTGTKNYPPRLDWSYASRTLASYADGKSHGDVFGNYQHMDEAMKFAEANWGADLILDDWNSIVEFYVQDPTELVNDRYHKDYPRTKAVLYVTLNRELNEVINDHSKPQSELFDDAISQMTLDSVIWHELRGGRGGYTEFNCAHCGAGLSLSSCTGCGHRFRDDQFRCGWNTPLSQKMVAFLREKGHAFEVGPEIAWETEQRHFAEISKRLAESPRRRQ
ncbi:MAG: hypothetical protein A3B86_00875 [Candidatus Yanofskybacteria bacterium RIFCSPHIGHO2_02_FULL_38_22b]|uniref:Uncharacterized protein n=1 Tax=Candidatus Yanofskybacteria bacterium RIFCSPHIGHO2_02_FULL_38_22b TaxID=1802673 RepID=A0A1F8F1N3_9BACT|nr:MAG: hypothetical protein A2816_00130 [Candidatus Yanofskybacteria bacterium RIFCSPHIGHO2_01_FULL_39_44]OGN07042.1 MAG: hypothetical protein A3B86_00875 [Candidatus Yanofskybacteria bacterium RIFCSPHIGHO2_02_FULL_38_22b]